jgi:uncharacterized protein (TIGR00255 family)
MIASMTGYGRGEASDAGIAVTVELRSVNSRFLEVSTRLPRSLALRENEIKEQIRARVSRGKVSLLASVERGDSGDMPLKINVPAAKAYVKMLNQLKRTVRLNEKVKIDHLLRFSEIITPQEIENTDETEWAIFQRALDAALGQLVRMKQNEGGELKKDFQARIGLLEEKISQIEALSKAQVPQERVRLKQRVEQLLDGGPVDEGRLELELAMLADRVDVTEECVRFRSHDKFFLEALENDEPTGRRLNFLVQEMNREANTIGSKSTSSEIAHLVVAVKEELEKIREQLQNIE